MKSGFRWNEFRRFRLFARSIVLAGMLMGGIWLVLSGYGAAGPEPEVVQRDNKEGRIPEQFIVVNTAHPQAAVFERVAREFGSDAARGRRVGIAAIFSYLHQSPEKARADLKEFLRLARQYTIAVVVQLDGEQWWGARPDLWNWWDAGKSGYDPVNRANVEWCGWGPDDAIRIAWRNWGQQIRVLPPPNLLSPAYRAACHAEMERLIPLILEWWQGLPLEQRWLLIGIKLGWESSIGVNAWYYPNGNDLADLPAEQDPQTGLKTDELPARGVKTIGYAAVKSAGLRSEGELTEADLAEIARRHLEDLCRRASKLGVPREKLFTHVAGWKEKEMLYRAGLNGYSCPGWSFYQYAADPNQDAGVQGALRVSDAPYWAAVEWLYQGPAQSELWLKAINNTLADSHCRYLCIYNWEGIDDNAAALEAIRLSVRGTGH